MEEETLSPNLETVVSELRKVRDAKEKLQEQIKELNHEEEEFERVLMLEMQQQGLTNLKTKDGSITLKYAKYYSIEDWNALSAYVLRSGHTELFQRRLAKEAVETCGAELQGEPLPGVGAYEKAQILFRRK